MILGGLFTTLWMYFKVVTQLCCFLVGRHWKISRNQARCQRRTEDHLKSCSSLDVISRYLKVPWTSDKKILCKLKQHGNGTWTEFYMLFSPTCSQIDAHSFIHYCTCLKATWSEVSYPRIHQHVTTEATNFKLQNLWQFSGIHWATVTEPRLLQNGLQRA